MDPLRLDYLRGLAPLAALALIAAEWLMTRRYDSRETAVSLGIFLGGRVVGALTAGLALAPSLLVYRHRVATIPMGSPVAIAALFLAVEFAYYWHHRAMHRVNWFWATHSVHHSSPDLNLSAALRLGWGGNLTGGILFYLPLVWIGFAPQAVAAALGAGLLYQFFLHVSRPVSLGPLGRVLNTPAHHHVHHASNPACLDKNFGSTLILFDRIFGTFAALPASETLRYGLASDSQPRSFAVLYQGWIDIAARLSRSVGWPERIRILFGRPV